MQKGFGMTRSPFTSSGSDPLVEEALAHLCTYLRFDTTNPPGRETRAAGHFLEILCREGVDAQLLEPAEGRGSLVARIRGIRPEDGPVVLLHHADVVAADPGEWSEDPFGAAIRDGYLYGRGALDMKSTGIVHLLCLLDLHRRRVPLRRDLVLLMVADEESGGRLGTCRLLEELPWLANASLVLDEGGFVGTGLAADQADLYCVSVAEKTPLHLLLHAHGTAGHGSVPLPMTVTERVTSAVQRILHRDVAPRVHPVLRAYFTEVAEAGGAQGNRHAGPLEDPLEDPHVRERVLQDPVHRALVHDTVVCTMLRGGDRVNVIPSSATAGLDCRLLPDTCPEAFLEDLRRLVQDQDVRLEPVRQEVDCGVSPIDGEFMDAMAACVREGELGGRVVPYVMTGAADGRYFRRRGIPTYGFDPFRLSREEKGRIHGVDERISLANLAFGLAFFSRLLYKLVADSPDREA